jgi:hypothetical protein
MCLACEEEALFFRYQLELAVAHDEIPDGFEPADFEAAGLPVPSRRQAAQPLAANPFSCDSPDAE